MSETEDLREARPSNGAAMKERGRRRREATLVSLRTLGPIKCWPWPTVPGGGHGYARITIDGSPVRVHRWAYEQLVGPIPEGLVLDHLCRNRACVNPSHLRVVTGTVNTLAGIGPTARNARKDACDNGHEFTPENTRIRWQGYRSCITCEAERRIRNRITWDKPTQCPHCPAVITASCLARHIRRRHIAALASDPTTHESEEA